MIIHTIPFPDKPHDWNHGYALNRIMDRANGWDWVCFVDNDAMHTTCSFTRQMEDVIHAYPEGSFTCWTNRCACPWQVWQPEKARRGLASKNDSDDMARHRTLGRELALKHWGKATDFTDSQLWSGFLMLIAKRTWVKIGGVVEGKYKGTDNDIHARIKAAGMRIYRMDGVYVYHWYGEDTEKKHDIAHHSDR